MQDEQGLNIINPETIKIIRNLRQKGFVEKQNREYYINLMIECLTMKYGNEKTPMTLIENHGQEWCINHGIIGYDYIVNVSFANARNVNKPKKPPTISGEEFNEDNYA
ncbi:MAG: hypothetical protein ACE5HO_18390 [bacterium]